MRLSVLPTVIVCVLASSTVARADGGTPRLLETHGGYRVAVFTSPTPLRAGPIDVSVLVQDATSGAILPLVDVTVQLRPRAAEAWTITHPATAEAATNKLFRSAVFELPSAGTWEVEVTVDGPSGSERFDLDLDAAEPP